MKPLETSRTSLEEAFRPPLVPVEPHPTRRWLLNISAEAIRGAGLSLGAVIADPVRFHPWGGGSWTMLARVAIATALLKVGAFLVNKPLPSWQPPKENSNP